MPLSAIFQLYCLVAVSFIGGRKRTTQAEKTTVKLLLKTNMKLVLLSLDQLFPNKKISML
jgi:hypothetical protein